ncbi:MAG: dihydrodipicolinate synthase family protein [Cyclobacteriaceae bacterium]|nr:dihydrodipicolinate synthase family protein [Cyclobacteriaceae bacterium]
MSMHKVESMKGIIGVINTPFTHNNDLDIESLHRYVEHSISCGVVGFLCLGMAAEIHKLNANEKINIVQSVVDKVNGRVPVIANITADSQNKRLHNAKNFTDLGADGLMLSLVCENENDYLNQVEEIDKLTAGFLMIQDWDFKDFGLPLSLILKMFNNIESFKCLKVEVVPAGVKYSQVLEATDGKLHVSGGWASTQMIEALDRGVHAFMPTILHDVYTRVYRLHQKGDRIAAKQLFYELVSILAFSHQHLDISIHFNKRMVHQQGIFSTDRVREPILPFDSYHENISNELIQKAKNLCERLKKEYPL